jgi:hypothetical protein
MLEALLIKIPPKLVLAWVKEAALPAALRAAKELKD